MDDKERGQGRGNWGMWERQARLEEGKKKSAAAARHLIARGLSGEEETPPTAGQGFEDKHTQKNTHTQNMPRTLSSTAPWA